jgi:hypothetical protein
MLMIERWFGRYLDAPVDLAGSPRAVRLDLDHLGDGMLVIRALRGAWYEAALERRPTRSIRTMMPALGYASALADPAPP